MSEQSTDLSQESKQGSKKESHDNSPLSFSQVLEQEQRAAFGGDALQRSALCISGGGIRSATFGLGALQALAELGILEHFDYLSTVSGGGYIGSWLTSWKQRWNGLKTPKQIDSAGTTTNVIRELAPCTICATTGPDPIQHLREYNNYLSPKLGFFSADTWTLVATVSRNMLLNWLVFIPLLLCALTLPRIVLAIARLGETYTWYPHEAQSWFNNMHYVLPVLGGLFFAAGIFNLLRYLPGIGRQNHTQGQFLKYCFGFIFLAALSLLTIDAWFTGGDQSGPTSLTFWQLFFCIAIPGALGYLAYGLVYWRTLQKKFRELDAKKNIRKWPRTKWVLGLVIAAALTSFSIAGGAWLLISEQFRNLQWSTYVTFAMPLLFLSFGLAVTVFVGFTSRVLEDEDREWLARAGAWAILCMVCWAGLSTITLLAPTLLFSLHKKLDSALAAGGVLSGLVSVITGLSSKTKIDPGRGGPSQSRSSFLLDIAGRIAAPLFILFFLTCLAILTNWILWKSGRVAVNWLNHPALLEHTRTEDAILFAVLCLSFSWLMAKFIDINKFSLQAMYRDRIIRAYLGASNDKPEINKFTGFDRNDNLPMKDLSPSLKPFHVVNVTLNLVAGERLAWQQRRAAAFTFSSLHSGCADLGYRPSAGYGGQGGMSLGTAVAISGAAASPNMGYHSSPALTFIMTLFNARLGSWLGNPKHKRWADEGPRSAFDSIIREAFGLTNESSPYVYLSDGGHFENLGLYEMVRRHCRYILVLDSACDSDYAYEDLGNALRKIRIDMKIPIEFITPLPLPGQQPKKRCAVANILYKEVDAQLENGYLIYIKPAMLQTEPSDVAAYQAANVTFPHESTANQWFNESQTESYRMLGLHSIKEIFGSWNDRQQFEELVQVARDYLNPRSS
jgi:hypothetical protein